MSHYTLKFLIVDDSPAFLALIKNMLAKESYQLNLCESPTAALREFESFKPDIVLCDLEMPEIHGYDFVRMLRQMPEAAMIPILVMTNQLDTDAMSKSILAGADAFVTKDELRHALKPHILALLRLKMNYEKASQGKQLEAIQALIGTYRHEFGNGMAVLEAAVRKFKRTHPEVHSLGELADIEKAVLRVQGTLSKLEQIREYCEGLDANKHSKVMKTG